MTHSLWNMRFLIGLNLLIQLIPRPASADLPAAVHVVVLADGRELATRSRPTIAFGQVSFLDSGGHLITLPASRVNIAATRARGPGSTTRRLWDEKALAELSSNGVVLTMADGEASNEPGDLQSDAGVPRTTREQVDKYKAEIQALEIAVEGLSASDRQTTLIRTRQRQIQEAIYALTSAPAASASR